MFFGFVMLLPKAICILTSRDMPMLVANNGLDFVEAKGAGLLAMHVPAYFFGITMRSISF